MRQRLLALNIFDLMVLYISFDLIEAILRLIYVRWII